MPCYAMLCYAVFNINNPLLGTKHKHTEGYAQQPHSTTTTGSSRSSSSSTRSSSSRISRSSSSSSSRSRNSSSSKRRLPTKAALYVGNVETSSGSSQLYGLALFPPLGGRSSHPCHAPTRRAHERCVVLKHPPISRHSGLVRLRFQFTCHRCSPSSIGSSDVRKTGTPLVSASL